jgi:hypothetical protein
MENLQVKPGQMILPSSAFRKRTGLTSKTIILCASLFMFSILVWEHVGRGHEMNFRPSIGLKIVAGWAQDFFTRFGKFFAWVSSFLTNIDLQEVWKTIYDIGRPIFDICTSVFYFAKGYVEYATEFVNKTWLVYVGSIVVGLFFVFGWYKLSSRYPRIDAERQNIPDNRNYLKNDKIH